MSTTDIAIIGAGPYGLSLAAYLAPTGLTTRIFGTPMESWAEKMPRGMKLKSEGFASTLFDPANAFPLSRFCAENNIPYQDVGLPVELDVFSAYGQEFQRRLVPHLENTYITGLTKSGEAFTLTTALGETFQARRVVIATGITHFPYTPKFLTDLPAGIVTHSFDHHDVSPFAGGKVAVIGAGASACDIAALIHQAGATVDIISRSSINFHHFTPEPRPLWQRLKNPRSGLGLGWKSRLANDLPMLFHALPESIRLRAVHRHLGPAPGWFVTEMLVGKVPMHANSHITDISIIDGQAHITLTEKDGTPTTIVVDHIVAATGFRPSLDRLAFLDRSLTTSMRTTGGAPALSRHFESTIPGLYFIGLASANSFGPLCRFACGAGFAVKRLTRHLKPA